MRITSFALALLTASILAACGSGSSTSGNQALKTQFSAQVTFGDSLSDVGTYAVGTVLQLGGGKFTINGDNTAINPALTGKNWTQLMAAQFGLAAPCAAQTGLNGTASLGFSVPVVNHAACFGYAQGGARVTNPVGPGNAATGSALGALTVPLVTQVQNHLTATGGSFTGNEIVLVMAGGNDALFQLATLSAGATTPTQVLAAMATAGSDLVALVKTQMLAKGANFVTVNNLPDLGSTPFALAQTTDTQALIAAMVSAFNAQLVSGFAGEPRVLLVDVYAVSHDESLNPAPYGLTNVSTPACDLTSAKNPLASSLVCNGANLIAGDVSHYAFADTVHPTPFNNFLLARYVSEKMVIKGWL